MGYPVSGGRKTAAIVAFLGLGLMALTPPTTSARAQDNATAKDTKATSSASAAAQPKENADPVPVSDSPLFGVALPKGAQRMIPSQVPEGITKLLHQIAEGAGPKTQQGDFEVIGWIGGKKKPDFSAYRKKVASGLRERGWTYEETPPTKDNPFTIIVAYQTKPTVHALVGFWIPVDNDVMLAWTEVVPAKAKVEDTDTTIEDKADILPGKKKQGDD